MKARQIHKPLLITVACLCMAVMVMGCPSSTKVTTLFTTGSALTKVADENAVAIEDIASLNITINKIVLVPEDEAEEFEAEGADKAEVPDSHELVFDGEMVVNLLDMVNVSEVLSSAAIPPGSYPILRLWISNPQLELVSDPGNIITDIHLTASDRLFCHADIVIPEGQTSLLLVDFGGIKLVENGNGGYVLTPILDAMITVSDAATMVYGTIISVNDVDDTMVVEIEGSGGEQVTVDYSSAVLTFSDATDALETDLVAGEVVDVAGWAQVDGSVAADVVEIQLPAP